MAGLDASRGYEFSATLQIERAPIEAVAGSGNMFPLSRPIGELMATHIHILQGDAVLRPVAERFGLSGELRNVPVKLKSFGVARKISEAEIDNGWRDASVRLAEAARADSHPASPNVPLNCAMALLISVVGACGGAVVLESRGHRIRGADDLGAARGARMVARLPAVPAWRGLNGFSMFSDASHTIQPGDRAVPRFREQVRILRNGLLQISGKPGERAIAVMSPSPGEGRSRVAAELAMAFAASGQRTLLIDANLRAPVLHALLFSTGARDGLASSLAGETRWRECVRKAEQEGFDLLPSGAADARSFDLMHQHFADIMEQARGEYQCVVVDSPPFLCCSESLDIARAVDAVIVMARARMTDERAMQTMMDYLHRINVQAGAVILNDA